MFHPDNRLPASRIVVPLLCLFLTLVGVCLSINFKKQPRFDETGYLILGKSLGSGTGYREIDRPPSSDSPGSPRHAHYPPGWPSFLSGVLRLSEVVRYDSLVTAHFSVYLLWVTSVFLWLGYISKFHDPSLLKICFIVLPLNWSWIRLASEFHSESLFIPLTAISFLCFGRYLTYGNYMSSRYITVFTILNGALVGFCFLVRHAAVALLIAFLLDLTFQRQFRNGLLLAISFFLVVLPWLLWQYLVGQGTQAELVLAAGSQDQIFERILNQSFFYLVRMPDVLFGPFLETATVFQKSPFLKVIALFLGVLFLVNLIKGCRLIYEKSAYGRISVLYLVATFVVLLLWPFTEAGRFLIPLLPIILLATLTGYFSWVERLGVETLSSGFVLLKWFPALLALPFGLYTIYRGVHSPPADQDFSYNRACYWIRDHTEVGQVVSARHPGDVFWRSGHQSLPWPNAANLQELYEDLSADSVQWLLIDRDRYANAQMPEWSQADGLNDHPEFFRHVVNPDWSESSVSLYEVVTKFK
jgi:hypothetical protein